MRENSFRHSGLRVSRLFGIDIWAHWILLLIIGLKLFDILLQNHGQYGTPLLARKGQKLKLQEKAGCCDQQS